MGKFKLWLLTQALKHFTEGGAMQFIAGYKTIIVFGLSFIAYLLGWDQLTQYVSAKHIAEATAVIGVVLRFITTTPIFTTSEKAT